VRSLIRLRKLRRDYLGAEIFFDPAWDMLLDLYAARLEGRRVNVSSLCMAAGVASTTALRWMQGLEAKCLITRHPDQADGRRVFMELSDDTSLKMDRVLRAAQMQSITLL
jgi:DNA-binding MarR family transcriptional regulator